MPTFDTTDASPQKHEEAGLPDAASDEASLQEHGLVTPSKALSPTGSIAVWTKMDLVVLPIVTMMYFLSSLDRTNIGNARIAGFQQDLHISNIQYSLSLTIALIPYVLIEIPSNTLMMHIGPRILLPTLVILWGIACALQGVVTNFSGLLACRFFLGVFEGGLPPGIYFYLSSFYPRRLLQLRISIMFSATGFASAFSGLLAAAILKMDGVGDKPGWAWVFILEGLFSVLFGIASYMILPDTPAAVQSLTVTEKELVSRVLLDDGIVKMQDRSNRSWTELRRTFAQPHILMLGVAGIFNGTTVASLSYYLPSIVASLGFSGTKAQLMSVPPFAASAALAIVTALFADHFSHRGLTLMFASLVATAGFALFLASFDNHVRYGSLFLAVSGTYCSSTPLAAWTANNVAPAIRRATALAFYTMMANIGAIFSTWLFGALSSAPRYRTATATLVAFQVGVLACAVCVRIYLARENRRKVRERLQAGSMGAYKGHAGEISNENIWFEYVM